MTQLNISNACAKGPPHRNCCTSVRLLRVQEGVMTWSACPGTLALGDKPQTLETSIFPAYQGRKTILSQLKSPLPERQARSPFFC